MNLLPHNSPACDSSLGLTAEEVGVRVHLCFKRVYAHMCERRDCMCVFKLNVSKDACDLSVSQATGGEMWRGL